MESLPLLPGYNFADPTFKDYKIKQKLKFRNGFRMINDDYDVCHSCSSDDCPCNAKLVAYDPSLTYGRPRNGANCKPFLPHYVLFDRKCLSFEAYFKQGIFGSADEHWRVRQVRLIYYLEDDTMALLERPVKNAGFRQGKLVRRERIPRPDKPGTHYHWKDLNVAMDIEIYGVVYRVVSCDEYTREFLTSQGLDVAESEPMPADPYLRERAEKERQARVAAAAAGTRGSLATDRRFLFLEYAGLVLTFEALWNGELYKLRYFLDDDTIAVSETGEHKGRLLLKRTKVPKNWNDLSAAYPAAYLERTDEDVREFYAPIDLKVGTTVFIFGRRFLLYDCDRFTRKYYADVLKQPQPERIRVPEAEPSEGCSGPATRRGRERNQDLLRRLYNFPKRLRYGLAMEAVHPEDEGREFVLEYDLSDGAVRISELKRQNSGRLAGCFLGWTRVPKPGAEDGSCYTPEDFGIGARLQVFGHWFRVTDTEPFVYKYMLANPDKFDQALRDNVREHLRAKGLIAEGDCCPCESGEVTCDCEEKREAAGGDGIAEARHCEGSGRVGWKERDEGTAEDRRSLGETIMPEQLA